MGHIFRLHSRAMKLIGMPEAARQLGLSRGDAAKRLLEGSGVVIHRINGRALAVADEDVERVAQARREVAYSGRGRPRGRRVFNAVPNALPKVLAP